MTSTDTEQATPAPPRPRAGRRELMAAALLMLAGAALALFAAGKAWANVDAPGAIVDHVSITGSALADGVVALGWAGMAGLAALFAVRGVARAGLGALMTAAGVAVAYVTLHATGDGHITSVAKGRSQSVALAAHLTTHTTGWIAAAVAGGVLLALGGLLTLVRGARWPGMSSRYERGAAAARRPEDPSGIWKALDRGEDPTGE